jgi:hypothetical protein
LAVVCVFSCVGVGGCRGSGPGWWMCVEAAALGFMVGRCFMWRSSCLHGLGDYLVSLVRRGCRLDRHCLRGGNLTFRPGRRPRMLVRRPWSTSSFPVQLGLRVAGSCGVAARGRAVVCRDGGPGRWCWWFAGRGGAVGCRGGSLKGSLC